MGMLETAKTRSNYFIHINLYYFIKRLLDVVISVVLVVVLSPLFLFVSYYIGKKEGKPIFNRELRVGKNNRTFMMLSFRTMTSASRVIRQFPPVPFPSSWERGVPDFFKITRDEHVTFTETGLWLKKYHLDKLPQLLNVIKGDMSLVGPSPEVPEIAEYYNKRQLNRLKVRPGLTGYAQIKGIDNERHGQKIIYDLYYTQNCSYKLDLKIVFRTILQLYQKK
ncbi:MAG TPA: glycosyl transferase [Ornithinibacillus sp.]|nr:glycosyl transferase [Ornithinibacillus sp.]